MAVICRHHNLLAILTPRTACSAVATVLQTELQGVYIPEADTIDAAGRVVVWRKHTTLRQLERHALISQEQRRQLTVFTTVRNPFDSLVSLYIKKARTYQPLLNNPNSFVHRVPGYAQDMLWARDHSFEEWLFRRFGAPWLQRFLDPRKTRRSLFRRYTEGVDVVLKLESLQEDFDRLMQQVGVGRRLTIPNLNATPERLRDYRRYYTPRARRLIEAQFRDELERYGYSF